MKRRPFVPALLAALAVIFLCQEQTFRVGVNSSRLIQGSRSYAAVNFDPNAYYRLTTLWQGECRSLDIINDGRNNRPTLNMTGDVSGQYWKITAAPNGYYRLTTMWQGLGESLDVINDGQNNKPILNSTGDFSGQYWKITPTTNGYFRLTTLWQGPGKSLDIINDGSNNRPILNTTSDLSGQYWKISVAKFVTAPPASLRLDPFYKKYLDADGIPVISSVKVPDAALYQARFRALHMLSKMPAVLAEMARRGARMAIMAETENTTDIPEHAFLRGDKALDWNARARGLGGTVDVPAGSGAEENLLCYPADRYRGEDIFIHEFAHSIHKLGLVFVYPDFQRQLDTAYNIARRTGLWRNTYAITNSDEYFAEGLQDWFNVNLEANPPNGIHNQINTRAELRGYDPRLYLLLRQYFPEDDNKCSCH